MCVTQWLPESPRFDVLSGRREKAIATLARVARENGKEMPRGTLVEYKQVRLNRNVSSRLRRSCAQRIDYFYSYIYINVFFFFFFFAFRVNGDSLKIFFLISTGKQLFFYGLYG